MNVLEAETESEGQVVILAFGQTCDSAWRHYWKTVDVLSVSLAVTVGINIGETPVVTKSQ